MIKISKLEINLNLSLCIVNLENASVTCTFKPKYVTKHVVYLYKYVKLWNEPLSNLTFKLNYQDIWGHLNLKNQSCHLNLPYSQIGVERVIVLDIHNI